MNLADRPVREREPEGIVTDDFDAGHIDERLHGADATGGDQWPEEAGRYAPPPSSPPAQGGAFAPIRRQERARAEEACRRSRRHRSRRTPPRPRTSHGVRPGVLTLVPVHPDRDPIEGADPRHRRTLTDALA